MCNCNFGRKHLFLNSKYRCTCTCKCWKCFIWRWNVLKGAWKVMWWSIVSNAALTRRERYARQVQNLNISIVSFSFTVGLLLLRLSNTVTLDSNLKHPSQIINFAILFISYQGNTHSFIHNTYIAPLKGDYLDVIPTQLRRKRTVLTCLKKVYVKPLVKKIHRSEGRLCHVLDPVIVEGSCCITMEGRGKSMIGVAICKFTDL